jgi:hypothetical protein
MLKHSIPKPDVRSETEMLCQNGSYFAPVLFVFIGLFHHCAHFEGKAKKIDESVSIFVVVKLSCCEAGNGFVVERIGACGSGWNYVSFVEFELNIACDSFVD